MLIKEFYVYLYVDPKDNVPIYVGKGHKRRAWAHFHTKSKLGNVIRKRISEGFEMQPIIICRGEHEFIKNMEIFWIAYYGRADLDKGTLFNLTDGGEGTVGCIRPNRACSPETRQKIKDTLAKYVMPEDQKKQLSDKLKESQCKRRAKEVITDEFREKIRQIRTGIPRSEETKQKIRNTFLLKKLQKSKDA